MSTLSLLSNVELLEEAQRLAASERHATAGLVRCLIEVEDRRMHLAGGCGSMFAYCDARNEARHRGAHRFARPEAGCPFRRPKAPADVNRACRNIAGTRRNARAYERAGEPRADTNGPSGGAAGRSTVGTGTLQAAGHDRQGNTRHAAAAAEPDAPRHPRRRRVTHHRSRADVAPTGRPATEVRDVEAPSGRQRRVLRLAAHSRRSAPCGLDSGRRTLCIRWHAWPMCGDGVPGVSPSPAVCGRRPSDARKHRAAVPRSQCLRSEVVLHQ